MSRHCTPSTSSRFPKFPKAGANALEWFDSSIDKIIDAGPNTDALVRWAGDMRRLTLDELHEPVNYAGLDHKIRIELLELIPDHCQLHYDVKLTNQRMMQREQRLTGRQIWRMIYNYFQENEADREVADMKKLG